MTVVLHPLTDDRRVLPLERTGELLTRTRRVHARRLLQPGLPEHPQEPEAQHAPALPRDRARLPARPSRSCASSRPRAACEPERVRPLINLAARLRQLKGIDLEESVSTRLLVYAATLIRAGLDAADRARGRADRAALRRRRRQAGPARAGPREPRLRRPWPRVPGIRGEVRPALAPAGRRAGELAALPRGRGRAGGDRAALAVFFRGAGGEPGLELAAARRPAAPATACACAQRLGMVEERLARAERTDGAGAPAAPARPPARAGAQPRPLSLARGLPRPARGRRASATDPLRRGPRPPARGAPGHGPRCSRCSRACGPVHAAPRRRVPGAVAAAPAAAAGAAGRERRQRPPGRARARPRALGRGGGRRRRGQPARPAPPTSPSSRCRSGARSGPACAGTADEADEDRRARARSGAEEQHEAPHRRGVRREREEADGRGPLTLINKGELLLLADRHGQRQPARRRGGSRRGAARGRGHGRARPRQPRPQELEPPASCSSTSTAAAVDAAPVRAELAYPEWDYQPPGLSRTNHCAVLAGTAPEEGESWEPDEAARRQIRRVRRQFEALRPRREIVARPARRPRARHRRPGPLPRRPRGRRRRQRRRLPRGPQPRARPRRRDPGRRLALDRRLARGPARARRREAGAHRAGLGHRGLRRPVGDPGLHLAPPRGPGRSCSRASTSPWARSVRRRIAALRPGQYTRMGAALRHAAA